LPPYINYVKRDGEIVGYSIGCKYLNVEKSFQTASIPLEENYKKIFKYWKEHVEPFLKKDISTKTETILPIYETNVKNNPGYICVMEAKYAHLVGKKQGYYKKTFSSQKYSMTEKYEIAKKWYFEQIKHCNTIVGDSGSEKDMPASDSQELQGTL
jgi:hypothetical protein